MIVAIDAGHGGRDPGAVAGGIREKDVVRMIAVRTGIKVINRGWRPVFTRDRDEYTLIRTRAVRANQVGADVVVSFHLNASVAKGVYGLWILHHETSTRGRNLALHVFSALEEKRITGLIDPDPQKEVYADGLSSGWTGNRRLGILRQTIAPAILIECGFITHDDSREMLLLGSTHDAIAEAVVEGIAAWKQDELEKVGR